MNSLGWKLVSFVCFYYQKISRNPGKTTGKTKSRPRPQMIPVGIHVMHWLEISHICSAMLLLYYHLKQTRGSRYFWDPVEMAHTLHYLHINDTRQPHTIYQEWRPGCSISTFNWYGSVSMHRSDRHLPPSMNFWESSSRRLVTSLCVLKHVYRMPSAKFIILISILNGVCWQVCAASNMTGCS